MSGECRIVHGPGPRAEHVGGIVDPAQETSIVEIEPLLAAMGREARRIDHAQAPQAPAIPAAQRPIFAELKPVHRNRNGVTA